MKFYSLFLILLLGVLAFAVEDEKAKKATEKPAPTKTASTAKAPKTGRTTYNAYSKPTYKSPPKSYGPGYGNVGYGFDPQSALLLSIAQGNQGYGGVIGPYAGLAHGGHPHVPYVGHPHGGYGQVSYGGHVHGGYGGSPYTYYPPTPTPHYPPFYDKKYQDYRFGLGSSYPYDAAIYKRPFWKTMGYHLYTHNDAAAIQSGYGQPSYGQPSYGQPNYSPRQPQYGPSPAYQAPSTPYQAPSTPYQAPSTPYQATSTPYQAPSTPYQPPSTPYPGPPSPNYQAPPAQSYPAPPTQNYPAPPSQNYQAPPSQNYQAPPSQNYQAPPSQNYQAPPSQPAAPYTEEEKGHSRKRRSLWYPGGHIGHYSPFTPYDYVADPWYNTHQLDGHSYIHSGPNSHLDYLSKYLGYPPYYFPIYHNHVYENYW